MTQTTSPQAAKLPVEPGSGWVDSPMAWQRLWLALALMTIGGSGMYAIMVVLPQVQAEFGVSRAQASLPYAMTMLGFGAGGIVMGRMADRYGVALPLIAASTCLGLGFVVAGLAPNYWVFIAAQGLLIGLLGSSATFGPLMTDVSFWFAKRRGMAVAICASGNYLAGAFWPPVVQAGVESIGWRYTYVAVGVFCVLSMVPLSWAMHRGTAASQLLRSRAQQAAQAQAGSNVDRPLGWPPMVLLSLLIVAGVACCVAMAMPQVHIVAYCADLGYGARRGAQMLATMLAFGVASRLISGWICDRIGGLKTLLLGSSLQGLALLLFLPFDGMMSLFLISALFGLFQGGIVPSYAIIVREYFSPQRAGSYVGIVLMSTLVGMALGGWLSGKMFDWTGSYQAAFINGIAWNLLNLTIATTLLLRAKKMAKLAKVNTQAPATSTAATN